MIGTFKKLIKNSILWLHKDFNRNLGIENTYRLSKGLNTLTLGWKWRRYTEAYLNEFERSASRERRDRHLAAKYHA